MRIKNIVKNIQKKLTCKVFSGEEDLFKRQWGAEKELSPLSSVHERPSDNAIVFSRLAVVMTVVFWLMYVTSVVLRQLIDGPQNYDFTVEVFGYLVIVSLLTFSALIYLIARQGAFQRFKKHVRVPQFVLDKHFSKNPSSITVLVPSYGEEVPVIRKTLLSAALQEFPEVRVVLLLDDAPFNIKPEDMERMEQTYALCGELNELLSEPFLRFSNAREAFDKAQSGNIASKDAVVELANQYIWASSWLDKTAEQEVVDDHVDVFFAQQVLQNLAEELRTLGREIERSSAEGEEFSKDRVLQLYNRLVWIFGAKMELFERKRYISLSHEINKAMNLNAYISLMGGAYIKERTSEGVAFVSTEDVKNADMVVKDSDFILTLDADSILLQGYCSRLVHFLQQPDNADVAVVQTPYSSFRGAPSRIERLAGATTDIQHIIHQGMSYYNATFWVGANAVIRKSSLEDIVEKEWVGGFEVKRYVQDRTVIEDTESSIDLALNDWRLVNYPERLSYSATPPDFGSLVIQRRRWANGGLLILPKLWKLAQDRKNQGRPLSKIEFMVRLNYMASIAWSNIGLILLLAYPYDGRLLSPFVLLAASPYFISMAVDLKYCRYKYTDIIRIYGFNLILLPVNIAGTLKSIQQALTTKKIPFARTPKVKNRTATAWIYVVSPMLIILFSLFTLWRNIYGENWGNAAFAGFNTFAATWAMVAYIGFGNAFADIWVAIKDALYVDVKIEEDRNDFRLPRLKWLGVVFSGNK